LVKMFRDIWAWITNSPRPPMSYDQAWRDLRARMWLFWILSLSWAPVLMVLGLTLDTIRPGLADSVLLWIAIPLVALAVAAGFYWEMFPCPRCGEWFLWGGLFGGCNPFRRKCQYCGLRRGQLSDDQEILDSTGPKHNGAQKVL